MRTKLAVLMIAFALLASSAFAWNRSGHLVSGAITYDALKSTNPVRLAELVSLLQSHPASGSWADTVASLPHLDAGKVLFMMAAVFPDDARSGQFKSLDRPDWHYVNFAFTPDKPLADVKTSEPFAGKLIAALQENLAIVRDAARPAEARAVALCWVLHLVGDLHQPLHVTAFVNDDFPNGDRGGNSVFVRGSPRASQPVNLHMVWDSGVGGQSTTAGRAAQLASALMKQAGKASDSDQDIREWIAESYQLAARDAYLNGSLKYAKFGAGAPLLPDGYTKRLKEISETQIVRAGQRAAGLLAK